MYKKIRRAAVLVIIFLLAVPYPTLSVLAAGNQFTVSVSVVNDTTPPSVPTGLTATAISDTQINLSWTASTDNVAVAGYVVRRGGAIIATTTATTYSSTGLTQSTSYTYTVEAFDSASNYSGQSGSASATTQAASSGPSPDTTPPSVSSFTPSNGAVGIAATTTTLTMAMSEAVTKFSGNILLKKYSDNSTVDTISVSSSQVSVAGSVVTITLGTSLASNTQYYVEVPAGAIADTAGNAFPGFSGNGIWSFTTNDTAAPLISAVSATSTITTGTITFTTDEPALSTIEWGTTTSYGEGSASEVGYTTSHSMTITGLTASTIYYYRLVAQDPSNNQSTPFTGTFTTQNNPIPPDTTPPANPSSFTGVPDLTEIALSWNNPPDPDFDAVRIMRQTSGYPASTTDGVLVYDGSGTSFTDTGLTSGTHYYYTAFARDVSLNYSSGAIFGTTTTTTSPPPPPPTPTPTPTPTPGGGSTGTTTPPVVITPPITGTSTGPFTDFTGTGTPSAMVAKLTLNDFVFTQVGGGLPDETLPLENRTVRTNGDRNLRISILAIKLPEVLKTIAISVADPKNPAKVSSYLLQINGAKTAYEAVLPPFALPGNYPFTISILDHERQALTQINGTFNVYIPLRLPSFIPPGVQHAIDQTVEVIKGPVNAVSPFSAPVGVAVGAGQAILLSTNITSLYDLYLLFLKMIGLLTGFFRRKKKEPWGVVYDSVTKRPLDPAYVIAQLREGKQGKGEAITDLDGRYGFLLNPGEYIIEANKTHYRFPSTNLKGKTRDELYENLYFGDPFRVRDGGVVQYNIPLDPIEFDWNEFAKNQDEVFKLYSKKNNIRLWIFNTIFFVGFAFSALSLVITPILLNWIIVGIYVAILSFQFFWKTRHKVTRVLDKATGKAIPFALIKIWLPGLNTIVKKTVADETGRFYFLIPPGTYFITIEAKQLDGSYKEVLRTAPRALPKGVVREDLIV